MMVWANIMTRDVHQVPGRVRFKVPGLRDDETLVWALPQALRGQDGVSRVEVRPPSNSLIVHYDPARTDCRALARFLNARLSEARGKDTSTVESVPYTAPAGSQALPFSANPLFPPRASADDFATRPMQHMAVVFGHAAFKVALEQAVRGGLSSLFRATLGRI